MFQFEYLDSNNKWQKHKGIIINTLEDWDKIKKDLINCYCYQSWRLVKIQKRVIESNLKFKKKMKIKSINLEINGQKVEISIEEAKNLYRQLKELLGNEKEYYPVYPSYPYWDASPYWKEQMPWRHEPVICSSDSSKGGDYSVLTENGVEARSMVNFSESKV